MKVHEETDKAASAEEAQDKLKAQIKKQRQEIMSKTAAATSGNIYRCIFPALVPYRKAFFFVPVLFFVCFVFLSLFDQVGMPLQMRTKSLPSKLRRHIREDVMR